MYICKYTITQHISSTQLQHMSWERIDCRNVGVYPHPLRSFLPSEDLLWQKRERLEGLGWLENPQTKPTHFCSNFYLPVVHLRRKMIIKCYLHKMYKKSNKDVLHIIGQVGKSTNKVTFFFLKLLLNQTKENEKEKRLDESGKEKKRLVNRSTY